MHIDKWEEQDVIYSSDIIARIEELQELRDEEPEHWETEYPDEAEELEMLEAVADEASSCGDWKLGEELIADRYFKNYAMQLAEDIGAIPGKETWPITCIDWSHAARELQYDYTPVELGDTTYWIRS